MLFCIPNQLATTEEIKHPALPVDGGTNNHCWIRDLSYDIVIIVKDKDVVMQPNNSIMNHHALGHYGPIHQIKALELGQILPFETTAKEIRENMQPCTCAVCMKSKSRAPVVRRKDIR